MPTVPFTVYRAGKESKQQIVDINEESFKIFQKISDANCGLTAEFLSTGKVSLCIEEPDLGDYKIELLDRGQYAPPVVEKLLNSFDLDQFNIWKKERLHENTTS